MLTVACVKISEQGTARDYTFEDMELAAGDYCVVDVEGEETTGLIANIESRCGDCGRHTRSYPSVLRKANERDIESWKRLKERERKALTICKQKARDHNLPMSVSCVRISERQNKITFNFTADRRIDFRELVKDLAATLKARIELWQIGVRDEARKMGGYGICGCGLCCSNWITDFKAVSIRMAKNQELTLSPSKLSGLCGRLMCCIQYEDDQYRRMSEELPPLGSLIESIDVTGHVIDRHLLGQWVSVLDSHGDVFKVLKDEIRRVLATPRGKTDDENGLDQVDVVPEGLEEDEETRLRRVRQTAKAIDMSNPAVAFALRGGAPPRPPAARRREEEVRRAAEDRTLQSRMELFSPSGDGEGDAPPPPATRRPLTEAIPAEGDNEDATAADDQSEREESSASSDDRQESRRAGGRKGRRQRGGADRRKGPSSGPEDTNRDKRRAAAPARSRDTPGRPAAPRRGEEEERRPKGPRPNRRKKPTIPGAGAAAEQGSPPNTAAAARPDGPRGDGARSDRNRRRRKRPGKPTPQSQES